MVVREWEDGSVEIHCQGRKLPYSVFDKNPVVSQGAVVEKRWKRLRRETGALDHKRFSGEDPPRVAPERYPIVRTILDERPDLTDQEVAWEFHRRTGRGVSRSSMNRTLLKLNLTQKKSLIATEQAEPRIQALRRRFIELAKSLDPQRLVFIDEAGSNIAMTREYARAPRGMRAHGCVPRNRGEVTTMLGALDLHGVRAMTTVEGATDAEVFETFLKRVLLRKLKPGDIAVLDNVGAHTRRPRSAGSSAPPGLACCTCRRTRRTSTPSSSRGAS